MEEKTSSEIRQQQLRRRRINKMKYSIVAFTGIWILILSVLMTVLSVKLIFLENKMDELSDSMISVEHYVENQNAKSAGSPEEKAEDAILDNSSVHNLQDESESDWTEDTVPDPDVVQTPQQTGSNFYSDGAERTVYLTFDDGPSVNTEKILDILKEHNIKATFFVIGSEEESAKALYQRIVAEGHTLGMHSFTHKYDVIYESLDAYIQDMDRLQTYLEEVTGVTTKLIRFPGGSSNQVSNVDMKELIRYVNEHGYTYFDWNVASGDATSQAYTPDELVQNVMNDVVNYKTSVVLMHDSSAKSTTVESLEPMIEQLEALGVEFLPIDETTVPIQHITAENVEY